MTAPVSGYEALPRNLFFFEAPPRERSISPRLARSPRGRASKSGVTRQSLVTRGVSAIKRIQVQLAALDQLVDERRQRAGRQQRGVGPLAVQQEQVARPHAAELLVVG